MATRDKIDPSGAVRGEPKMSRPRIRTIKPESWQDEKIGALCHHARLLRIVLMTMADDDGRFRALPTLIIGHGYPYDDDVTPAKVRKWLAEIERVGLVVLYSVDGVPYGELPNWRKHQVINKATPSELPPPPTRENSGSTTGVVREDDSRTTDPSCAGADRIGKERKGN
jgi:hypothetical protein